MENTYKITVGSVKGYEGWASFLSAHRPPNSLLQPFLLEIDFSKTSFLEPFHLVSLACIIEEYYLKGAKITFKQGGFAFNKYLNNINFYKFWEYGFDRTAFAQSQIDNKFNLWKISKEMIDSYANEVQHYFERNFFYGKDLQGLSITLKETFNNIYDHSESPVDGYVLTQYNPDKGEIITAVCDLGISIPQKINQTWRSHGHNPLSDSIALRAAFMRKVSSKSTPQNKGLGLSWLYSIVKALKGSLRLYSSRAILLHDPSHVFHAYETEQKFPGTLINIKLNTENLPQQEEEISDEEFTL